MWPPIIVAFGFVDTRDYRGPATVEIGGVYVPAGSLITVETRLCEADLKKQPEFQQGVLKLLLDAGRLEPGSYHLVPCRERSEPDAQQFEGLHRDGRDILESFCLANGAIHFRDAEADWPEVHQQTYRYQHRLVVTAASERAARLKATAMLPDTEVWADYEPESFRLVGTEGDRFVLAIDFAFAAEDDEAARDCVAEWFGPLVERSRVVLSDVKKRRKL
jgi:hypothetical protein